MGWCGKGWLLVGVSSFEAASSVGMLSGASFLCRICYTDTSAPQEDQYPPNIAVKVNHSYCSVPVSWGRAPLQLWKDWWKYFFILMKADYKKA